MKIQLPDNQCTGCGACYIACPQKAITLIERNDGFLYPSIDTEKCISCGLCMKSCHALDIEDLTEPVSSYAVQHKDKLKLKESTSGGAFWALADVVVRQHGVVYGCVYDEEYNASIRRAETLREIVPMHGSKYVWSSSVESYLQAEQDLKDHKTVLYVGLPCQVAGLRHFLKKEYSNLYLVDILCGGAPSPYAFKKYLDTLSTDKAGLHFQFRDKELHGSGVDCTYYLNGRKHHEDYVQNAFYFSFSSKSKISCRLSCYACKYRSIQRTSDLTIGDYWGVEHYHGSFNSREGVSVVLVNSEKGRSLFEKASGQLLLQESDIQNVIPKNSLVKTADEGHIAVPNDRDAFFSCLREAGWRRAEKKYLMTDFRKKYLFRHSTVTIKIIHILRKLSHAIHL